MGSDRSKVISRIAEVITYIRGLVTTLTTTHEPPSRALGSGVEGFRISTGFRA